MFAIKVGAVDGTYYFVCFAFIARFEVLSGEWVKGESRWEQFFAFDVHI